MQNTMTTTAADIDILTLSEAAALLKVKRRTLQEFWRPWGLRAVKTGREWKFQRSDIAAWIDENTESGAAY